MSIKLLTPLSPIHIKDGAQFDTFTAFQDISPSPQILIAQPYMEDGLDLWLYASGLFSNTGTPTLSIGFWFNTAATVLAQSSLITTTTGASSWAWIAEWYGTLRDVGSGASGGSWNGNGTLKLGTSLTAMTEQWIPDTLAERTVTCDVTAARAIGVGAQWGTSNAANLIKVNRFRAVMMTGL